MFFWWVLYYRYNITFSTTIGHALGHISAPAFYIYLHGTSKNKINDLLQVDDKIWIHTWHAERYRTNLISLIGHATNRNTHTCGGFSRGIMNRTLIGWRSASGGSPFAISIAVIPNDQISACIKQSNVVRKLFKRPPKTNIKKSRTTWMLIVHSYPQRPNFCQHIVKPCCNKMIRKHQKKIRKEVQRYEGLKDMHTHIYTYTHTHTLWTRIQTETFSLYPSEFWITSGAIQNGVPTNVCHGHINMH